MVLGYRGTSLIRDTVQGYLDHENLPPPPIGPGSDPRRRGEGAESKERKEKSGGRGGGFAVGLCPLRGGQELQTLAVGPICDTPMSDVT